MLCNAGAECPDRADVAVTGSVEPGHTHACLDLETEDEISLARAKACRAEHASSCDRKVRACARSQAWQAADLATAVASVYQACVLVAYGLIPDSSVGCIQLT